LISEVSVFAQNWNTQSVIRHFSSGEWSTLVFDIILGDIASLFKYLTEKQYNHFNTNTYVKI